MTVATKNLKAIYGLLNRCYILNGRSLEISITEPDLVDFGMEPTSFFKDIEFLAKSGQLELPTYDWPQYPYENFETPVIVSLPGSYFQKRPRLEVQLNKNFEVQYNQIVRDKSSSDRVEIYYSPTKGLFRADGNGKNYPIKTGSKRAKLLLTLIGSPKVASLAKDLGYVPRSANKAVKAINKICNIRLGIETDLILNNGTGYCLDSDKYNVERKS